MIVGELIEKLGKFDPELPVVIYQDAEMGDRATVQDVSLVIDRSLYWFDPRTEAVRVDFVWLGC